MDAARLIDRVIAWFIGTKHERDVKKLQPLVAAVNDREAEVKALSDDDLKARFQALKEPIQAQLKDLDPTDSTFRESMRKAIEPVHPLDSTIRGVSHVMWTDKPKGDGADGRNAVFYGDRAIDRSPCGTGTSARLAHLAAQGKLKVGDQFVHESIIGSRFIGRILQTVDLGGTTAIIPMIEGAAFTTGFNTLWIDPSEPFPSGFQVT